MPPQAIDYERGPVEILTHQNDPAPVIEAVRAFLSAKVKALLRTRCAEAIRTRFRQFQQRLPTLARALEISEAETATFEYRKRPANPS